MSSSYSGFPVITEEQNQHRCQNCDKRWHTDDLRPIVDIFERIGAGEPVPSGECPDCGALCQVVTPEPRGPRVVIYVSGGVCQGVIADGPVDYMLVDYDNENAEPGAYERSFIPADIDISLMEKTIRGEEEL